MKFVSFTILLLTVTLIACKKNNPEKLIKPRNFNMGFSTTSQGNEDIEFNQTYDTLQKYSDIDAGGNKN